MKTFVYPLLKQKFPELNERELLSRDFDLARVREKVSVISRPYPEPFTSCFVPRAIGGVIIVSHKLYGITRQFYEWYELGRYYLHAPRYLDDYRLWLRPEKDVTEAQALPLLALMPYSRLSQYITGFEKRRGFIRWLIKRRIYLFDKFGI